MWRRISRSGQYGYALEGAGVEIAGALSGLARRADCDPDSIIVPELKPLDDSVPTGWICRDCGVPLAGPSDDHECRFDEEPLRPTDPAAASESGPDLGVAERQVTPPRDPRTAFTLHLPPDLRALFEAAARSEGTRLAAWLRNAGVQGLPESERPGARQILADARAAKAEIVRENGRKRKPKSASA